MAQRAFYHVTERKNVSDIVGEGFCGGWGDVGFGVYFWGTIASARAYAAKNGWDGQLCDPVILEVEDPSIIQVAEIDPSWDAEEYLDMFWKPMSEDAENTQWLPAGGIVVIK